MTCRPAASQFNARPAAAGFLLIVIAFVLSGCATDWTQQDTRYELAFQVINAADAYTTSRIRHTNNVHEVNLLTVSLIGRQPTASDVALLFSTYGISHYLIAKALPEKWRRYYQVSSFIAVTYVVIENCQLDLC